MNDALRTRLIGAISLVVALYVGPALAESAPPAAQTCAACHGKLGEGRPAAGFPRLAGLPAAYLEKELAAFADGTRSNAVMQPLAKALDSGARKAVAHYYAQLETPSAAASQTSKVALAAGREIAVNGLWHKGIPSCMTCHGPGARGIAPGFPPLAGQGAAYIAAQIEAWRKHERPPGPGGLMPVIANALNAQQVQSVAAYLAGLPATGNVPASAAPDVAPTTADALPGHFQPPLLKDVPDDEFGASVKRGYKIFTQTNRYAKRYVGNGMDCTACHVNRGRQANSAPMWAAAGLYPRYRGKNHKINTMAMRLQGCFQYSENAPASAAGQPPEAQSAVIVDLQSYLHWMARGAPSSKLLRGQGFPALDAPGQAYSRQRGARVYATHCAMCHGARGQGRKLTNGRYGFPPLWGEDSFNWGAGMHRVNTAASFIRANMPLGNPGSLSIQEAWDVAAWIDSHPRPQDPRFSGDITETTRQFHGNRAMDFYGKHVDGLLLGAPGTLEKWAKTLEVGAQD